MDTAIIGIDGLDPDLVREWRDDLQTLSRLWSDGSFGRLRSSLPPLTAPAWSSFCTGKRGGKHGIYGFTRAVKESYERVPVDHSDMHAETLWEALDASDISCGVVNVPLTHPPTSLEDGFVVAGWPVPKDATVANPPSLVDELESELGVPYEVNPFPLTLEFDELPDGELRDQILDGLWHHQRAFEYLARKDPDVFFAVFMAIDIASHNFAWERETLHEVYIEQDRALKELIDTIPSGTDIIVVSDHGHGAKGRRSFHVNEWLREEGYLTVADTDTESLFTRLGLTQATYVRWKNRLNLGNLHEYLPAPVYESLENRIPRGGDDRGSFDPENIDWAETLAFSGEQNEIFINDDRFPEGSVSGDDVDALRKELKKGLKQIPHPDEAGKLMTEVATKHDVFDGPLTTAAPDLIFIADDMECNAPVGLTDGPVFTEERWGEHRQYGCLLTAGSSFETVDATDVENREITDVFPMILELVGAPIPENVDGAIPTGRIDGQIDPTYRKSRDGTGTSAEAPTPSEGVREQLEGLGYLE